RTAGRGRPHRGLLPRNGRPRARRDQPSVGDHAIRDSYHGSVTSAALAAVNDLLRDSRLSAMTLDEQRATLEAFAGGLPAGFDVTPVDAAGVPCEWVTQQGRSPRQT